MARTGRPCKEIDKVQFEKLCSLQCTLNEICSYFDCSDETINKWCKRTYHQTFLEVFAIKRGKGQISLRRTQWHLAEKSPAMAIWLGKQYLDQKDKTSNETEIENREKINALKEIFKISETSSNVESETE